MKMIETFQKCESMNFEQKKNKEEDIEQQQQQQQKSNWICGNIR